MTPGKKLTTLVSKEKSPNPKAVGDIPRKEKLTPQAFLKTMDELFGNRTEQLIGNSQNNPRHLTFKDRKIRDGDCESYSVFLSYRFFEHGANSEYNVFWLEKKRNENVGSFEIIFGLGGRLGEPFQTPRISAECEGASEDDYKAAFWMLMNAVLFTDRLTSTIIVDLIAGSPAASLLSQIERSEVRFPKVDIYLNKNTNGAVSLQALRWPGRNLGLFGGGENLDFTVRASLTEEQNATLLQNFARAETERYLFNKFSIKPNGEGGVGKIDFDDLVNASKGFFVREKMTIKPKVVIGDDIVQIKEKLDEFVTEVLAVGRENGVCVVSISIDPVYARNFYDVLVWHFNGEEFLRRRRERGERTFFNDQGTIMVVMDDFFENQQEGVLVTFTAASTPRQLTDFMNPPLNPEANAN